jgi:hypothetical protein
VGLKFRGVGVGAGKSRGQVWAQLSTSRPTARAFSAGFLADLLFDRDLGVSAVACVGQADGHDTAAFAAHGLDVHDLGLDPRRPAPLCTGSPFSFRPALLHLDRLDAVSRRGIALHVRLISSGVAGILRSSGCRYIPHAVPGPLYY